MMEVPDGFFSQLSLFTQKESSAQSAVKEVRLFDGSKIELKLKVQAPQELPELHFGALLLLQSGSATPAPNDDFGLIDIDKLFQKVELKKALKRSKDVVREAEQQEAASTDNNGSKGTKRHETGLWTEKHKPKTFMELCSAGNDRLYRQVLHWFRKWASLVFHDDASPQSMQGHFDDGVDHLGRPQKKILFIHGPVGIGKTVVAHMLASQQGYAVQELNAANSMDPSIGTTSAGGSVHSALKMKIINALTSNTITSNGKPSCLVIDEIDSAVNSADIVRVLTDLVHQDARSQYNASSSSSVDSKSKKKKPFQLNRPIICIANDIYGSAALSSGSTFSHSAIDKLRQHCEIVAFRKPVVSTRNSGNALRSIKEYLLSISKKEKLDLNYREVSEILEVCEGDIRSCINYLQFNKKTEQDSASDIASEDVSFSNLALKDAQLSWFAIVALLFKRDQQNTKDEAFQQLLNFLSNGGGKSLSSSSGTVDKVMKGCFNRYLDAVAHQDDSLVKPSLLSDWLWYYDQMDRSSASSALLIEHYAPIMYLKIWSMFSEINSRRNPKAESLVPSGIDFESYEQSKQNKMIMKRVIENLPLSTRVSIGDGIESSITLPGIFIPFLDKILTPLHNNNNKTINHEKIAGLVKALSFHLERHKDIESGEIKLQLAPELDTITTFQTELAPQPIATVNKLIQVKRQWLFPLIKKEIDLIESQKKRKVVTLDSRREAKEAAAAAAAAAGTEPEKSKRAKLTNSADFFKQRYDNLNEMVLEDTNHNHEATRIWVKYHEGFSNAVRKNIGWEDLWIPTHKLEA